MTRIRFTKNKKLLIHTTYTTIIGTLLQCFLLCERRQAQKITYCVSPLYDIPEKSIRIENNISVVARG